MLYIISGQPRSGTSMMMDAMRAGGLPLLYGEEREEAQRAKAAKANGPRSNSCYYELNAEQYADLFSGMIGDGMAVKLMGEDLFSLPQEMEHRVIFMRRDPLESHLSMHSHFHGGDFDNYSAKALFRDGRDVEALARMHRMMASCHSVHEFQFDDVLADPLSAFQMLKDAGWPIDPLAASRVVDLDCVNFGKFAKKEKAA